VDGEDVGCVTGVGVGAAGKGFMGLVVSEGGDDVDGDDGFMLGLGSEDLAGLQSDVEDGLGPLVMDV
jgi:hypothetical protein